MRVALASLLMSAAASAQPADNPVAMATGAHLKAVCSRSDDRASRIVCLSWLNGAAQGNGWFTPRDPRLTPAHCPPSRDFDLAATRTLILAWLDKHPADLARPSIEVFSRTMAARFPCKRR
jgi:hypothetical protein